MKIHDRWVSALKKTQADLEARTWKVTKLTVAPPARADVLKALGPLPKQLHDALLFSSKVSFGWTAKTDAPFKHGGLGAALWDVKEVGRKSLERWLKVYDGDDDFEAPHSREMWEGHVAFARLPNGDLLTVDGSKKGAQPVRYFSHEIEGLHGKVLAPDFATFFDEYIALGCPGVTQDDWFKLCPMKASSKRGKEWLAFLAGKVKKAPPAKANEAPKPIPLETQVDLDLIKAAEKGNLAAVEKALAAGANINASRNDITEKPTAFDLAAKTSNLPLLERLLAAGARVNTPDNALTWALKYGDAKTVSWLIAKGCSKEPRKNERYRGPLHALLFACERTKKPADRARMLENLEVLLKAGANVHGGDVPALGACAAAVPILLRHGADANRVIGNSRPLDAAKSKEHVAALVKAGANPNLRGAMTPLQWALDEDGARTKDVVVALMAAGADPWVTNTEGQTAFELCNNPKQLELLTAKGFDPKQTDAKGNTAIMRMLERVDFDHAAAVAFFAKKKVDVDAQNKAGDTALHIAARAGFHEAAIRALLKLGADKTLTNKKGETPAKCASLRSDKKLLA